MLVLVRVVAAVVLVGSAMLMNGEDSGGTSTKKRMTIVLFAAAEDAMSRPKEQQQQQQHSQLPPPPPPPQPGLDRTTSTTTATYKNVEIVLRLQATLMKRIQKPGGAAEDTPLANQFAAKKAAQSAVAAAAQDVGEAITAALKGGDMVDPRKVATKTWLEHSGWSAREEPEGVVGYYPVPKPDFASHGIETVLFLNFEPWPSAALSAGWAYSWPWYVAEHAAELKAVYVASPALSKEYAFTRLYPNHTIEVLDPLTIPAIKCSADFVVGRQDMPVCENKITNEIRPSQPFLFLPAASDARPDAAMKALTVRHGGMLKPLSPEAMIMASKLADEAVVERRQWMDQQRKAVTDRVSGELLSLVETPEDTIMVALTSGTYSFFAELPDNMLKEWRWVIFSAQAMPMVESGYTSMLKKLLNKRMINHVFEADTPMLPPQTYWHEMAKASLLIYWSTDGYNPRCIYDAMAADTPFLTTWQSRVPLSLEAGVGIVADFVEDDPYYLTSKLAKVDAGDAPRKWAAFFNNGPAVYGPLMSEALEVLFPANGTETARKKSAGTAEQGLEEHYVIDITKFETPNFWET